jgi:hypothetical protein
MGLVYGLRLCAIKDKARCVVLKYKVAELSMVAEDTLEEVLNEWSAKGWRFDGLHFCQGRGVT